MTYQIIDTQTHANVGKPYKHHRSATRRADKLDNLYGGYRYAVKCIDTPDPKATLLEKLSPAKLRLSPKMRWIIDSLTGQDHGSRGPRGEAPGHLSITSDGFVVSGSMFIGSYDDLKTNLDGILGAIEATYSEQVAFFHMFNQRVTDWRQ